MQEQEDAGSDRHDGINYLRTNPFSLRDFVYMPSRTFTLFDGWPEDLFESAGYVGLFTVPYTVTAVIGGP